MFDENRRKYPRVNYPCQLTIWLTDGSNETIMANTTNIGIGGLCVHLHQEIVVGTKLDIQLTFANTNDTLQVHRKSGALLQGEGKIL